jgi:hypothetical protein
VRDASPTRRRWLATLAAGAGASLRAPAAWAQRSPREHVKARAAMGINLAGLNYWNTELPFIDLMRMSGDWSLWRRDTNQPVKDLAPEVDDRGWLRALPEGLVARVPLAAVSHLPDSRLAPWVVLHEGLGQIEFEGALRVTRRAPGRLECEHVAQVPLPDPSLWLRVTGIDAADPLRNIRVLKPGTEGRAASSVWDAAFIERWSGWAALRAMDIMATNNSKLSHWRERPMPDDRTFAPRGIALELLIDLANRCGSSPWLCLPHLADDDYIWQSAMLVRKQLDDRLLFWVEHSNEVWNPDFEQSVYAAQQGLAKGMAADADSARWRWHARRSREIFALCSDAFGGARRLRRVLATQTGNRWGTLQLLRDPVIEQTDALGVSAYVPLTPGAEGMPTPDEVARWSVEQVFEHLMKALEALQEQQVEQRRWCARYGLLLAAYEGGQHAVGVGDAVADARLERLFTQANRDERMHVIYRRLYDRWEDADGDLFCHFSGVSAPSRWGNWGLLEHYDDTFEMRPKYRATLARMRLWRDAR